MYWPLKTHARARCSVDFVNELWKQTVLSLLSVIKSSSEVYEQTHSLYVSGIRTLKLSHKSGFFSLLNCVAGLRTELFAVIKTFTPPQLVLIWVFVVSRPI